MDNFYINDKKEAFGMKRASLVSVIVGGFLVSTSPLKSGFAMDDVDPPARDRLNSPLHAQLQVFRQSTDTYFAHLHSRLNISGLSNEEQYNLRAAQQEFTIGLANMFESALTVLEEQRRQVDESARHSARQARQIRAFTQSVGARFPSPVLPETPLASTAPPVRPQLGTPIRLEAVAVLAPPPPSLPLAASRARGEPEPSPSTGAARPPAAAASEVTSSSLPPATVSASREPEPPYRPHYHALAAMWGLAHPVASAPGLTAACVSPAL